jgi:hypothetical protein
MMRLVRMIAACMMPLLLAACLFQPGKFSSTLDINADRSFVFTYLGEIQVADMEKMTEGMTPTSDDKESAPPAEVKPKGMTEAEKAALAETLAKEVGFRKVEYRGDDIWFVDYRMVGMLTHSFLFPYNLDAEMIFPFVVIEPRANGTVRMKAPAFAKSSGQPGAAALPTGDMGSNTRIEGDFTLTTDAEIISQTNEDGAATGADGRKTIRWRITPQTDTAPMAVLRMRN